MVLFQEDEWKLMLGIPGMTQWQQLGKTNLSTALKNLLGQWVESMKVSLLSISLMFDDENVTKPQTPAAASTPVQTWDKEDKAVSLLKSPLGKKPCFQESIAECLLKTAPTCLEPDYNDAELVRYTQPSLVNVIPWIKYEAQNMLEPSFRQELQCIKEV